jgi:hypothetical protein
MDCSELGPWAGASATLLAVIIALFKEELIRIWRKPKLNAKLSLSAPDCHKIPVKFKDNQSNSLRLDSYYFRLWIENIGNQRAEKVQVFVSKLFQKNASGKFEEVKSFLPMNLRWAHSQMNPEIFTDGISPKMGKHCDLGHILDPNYYLSIKYNPLNIPNGKTLFELDLEVAPNTNSHLLSPGIYRFELKIAAANVIPIIKMFEINHTGNWHPIEKDMFLNGIGIKEV